MSARAALLIIDMQRDFCMAGGYADRAGLDIARLAGPIAPIARLATAFRAAGLPVIYTREGHRPDLADCAPAKQARARAAGAPIGSRGPLGRALIRGEYGHDIVDDLAPHLDDIIVDKPGYSAFHATDLDHTLRALGIGRLVLSGVTTEVCVHSTLRSAIDRGYDCVTVADATACDDPALHAAVLGLIANECGIFGSVADTDTVCAMVCAKVPA
ncbi:MAG TPA: isochorismatase family cysteine hydrolase [Acidiphilium sp.]|uniref:cysteine hydrolase family protein n=1 Tax=unclassified Acidiphilium TaxID=2617493 RepID=UPI000BDDBAD0|nr:MULTISPECIES: isochorismatase family cysteine hydrolase [unclassified Acidiphilium]OYV56923.1 MAG: cysteine hydrolase [Acidiphilium sp. 20-67-58]HQT60945.1 isochorismatase family cysteine hydrolase [Acidiphilium sp.]HQU11426.1 isochorismatase family cysteine hydrolase [Acidiphilium sp.]